MTKTLQVELPIERFTLGCGARLLVSELGAVIGAHVGLGVLGVVVVPHGPARS